MSLSIEQFTRIIKSIGHMELTNQHLRQSFIEHDCEILKRRGHLHISHKHENCETLDFQHITMQGFNPEILTFTDFVKIPTEQLTFENFKKLKNVCGFVQYLDSSSWATYKHLLCFQFYDVISFADYVSTFHPEATDYSDITGELLVIKDITAFYSEYHNSSNSNIDINDKTFETFLMNKLFTFYNEEGYKSRGFAFWIPREIYQKIISCNE